MIKALRTALISIIMAGGTMAAAEPVREVVNRTNQLRAQHGLPPLAVSPVLEGIAEKHGRDMVQRGFFSHTGSDGPSIGKRARRAGFKFCSIAENIAKGQRSAAEVTNGWINSPGHRRNMLKREIREIGVIRQAGNIWVMVLGTRRGGC